MAEQSTKPKPNIPAYTSYKSFTSFIRQFNDAEKLPSHIDRGVLARMSGSQQSSMLQSLLFLGLINKEGRPEPSLTKLVKASSSEYGAVLREIIAKAYSFIFADGLDLETTTTPKVEAKFREQGVSGSTVNKCIAFFLACCKDASIPVSKFVRTPPVTTVRPPRRNTSGGASGGADDSLEYEADERHVVEPEIARIHPLVLGFMKVLPEPGAPWPKAEREKWFTAFNAVLGLVYPEGGDS